MTGTHQHPVLDRARGPRALAAREQLPDETFHAAAERVATAYGRELGATQLRQDPRKRTTTRAISRLLATLGFEPNVRRQRIVLDNCPYDRLREVNTPLVCGINHAMLRGCLGALGVDDAAVRLDPGPQRCCVVVETGRAD